MLKSVTNLPYSLEKKYKMQIFLGKLEVMLLQSFFNVNVNLKVLKQSNSKVLKCNNVVVPYFYKTNLIINILIVNE